MAEKFRKSRREYPIRLSLMSEKGCEIIITIDRGKDTPEDHALVERLQHEAVVRINNRKEGGANG